MKTGNIAEELLFTALDTLSYEVYPQYKPQNKTISDYIIYNTITNTYLTSLLETSSLQNKRIQIDLYSKSYTELFVMETAVRSALELMDTNKVKVIFYGVQDLIDDEQTLLRRKRMDIKLQTF